MQHRVIEGESLQDVVNWMRVLINQFSGVWADNNYGSSSTLRIQSKAPSWAFSDIWVDSGVARLGGYVTEPFAIVAGVNDALLFTFGGEDGQQVSVTLAAGAARTGAEVAADIQAAFTAAGAPATAQAVSYGQQWVESPMDIAVEGSACEALGFLFGAVANSIQATLEDHLGDPGTEGDWELIDSVSPVMTAGAGRWIRNLAAEFAAAGIDASFAFSMEVYNPPAPMRAKYLASGTTANLLVIKPGITSASIFATVPLAGQIASAPQIATDNAGNYVVYVVTVDAFSGNGFNNSSTSGSYLYAFSPTGALKYRLQLSQGGSGMMGGPGMMGF